MTVKIERPELVRGATIFMSYSVYILECSDKTLYTGFTNNLDRRLWEHNHSNRGAVYTKYRRPVSIIYSEDYETQKEAMRRERELKTYTRIEKLEVIDQLWKKMLM